MKLILISLLAGAAIGGMAVAFNKWCTWYDELNEEDKQAVNEHLQRNINDDNDPHSFI